MAEHQPLTFLPHALIAAGYQSPGYRNLFAAACEGLIPAIQTGNGRWTFDPDDLESIARTLALNTSAALLDA